ncbi:hypothetical protein SB717_36875, partial [Priestia sp. SIMBA_032]|uniref:hypothetical protein n=1 Tax=Priestia sp. SIMBA_032 TaxID=3085775 RepID=UPI00397BFCCC
MADVHSYFSQQVGGRQATIHRYTPPVIERRVVLIPRLYTQYTAPAALLAYQPLNVKEHDMATARMTIGTVFDTVSNAAVAAST